MRRALATGASGGNTLFLITWFKGCVHIENVHPLEGGFLRLKFRRDRRSELPREPVWSFYPKYWWETAAKQVRWTSLYLRLRLIYLRVKRDPARKSYMDLALTPIGDDEIETHELFKTEAAQAYVSQERRLDQIRHGAAPSPSLQPPAPAADAKAPSIAG